MELEGKVAIVTGGGGGLGRAIALKLASRGARIVVADIDRAAAEGAAHAVEAAGGSALAVAGDITQARDVQALVEAAQARYAGVDILVNNAGFARLRPSILDIAEEEWDRTLTVNLKSVFLCTKEVLKVMLPKRAGQIINLASLAGRSTSTIGSADYTASKAGVIGLTRHVAREVAAHGIRVNAVCPGPTDTVMVRGPLDAGQIDSVESRIPMRRLGRPEEVAGVVAFLASGDSAYVTGACIDVNGGLLMV
ncbi:MAG: 3-oxoacyl-ACP reductase FabG [Proteobacteria bacterium]|nr:3-oxoacyl-ACP reductase FabG [Pseudomonadota bacterium]